MILVYNISSNEDVSTSDNLPNQCMQKYQLGFAFWKPHKIYDNIHKIS